jgi:hypothetical protein
VPAPAAAMLMPPVPVLAVANPAAWVLASPLCTTTASAGARQLPRHMGIDRGSRDAEMVAFGSSGPEKCGIYVGSSS